MRPPVTPGPSAYSVVKTRSLNDGRGKFNIGRSKNDVDWKIHRAQFIPGPADTTRENILDIQLPQGGRFGSTERVLLGEKTERREKKRPSSADYQPVRWPHASKLAQFTYEKSQEIYGFKGTRPKYFVPNKTKQNKQTHQINQINQINQIKQIKQTNVDVNITIHVPQTTIDDQDQDDLKQATTKSIHPIKTLTKSISSKTKPTQRITMNEPTFQAMLLDRSSLFFELMKPNKSFQILLWESCISIFQHINERRCGPSIQRLPSRHAKSNKTSLLPSEIVHLLSDVGIKTHLLSWYDVLWITRCLGKLNSNGTLPVTAFDTFSATFWHKKGHMQNTMDLTTGRIRASTFTLSCIDTGVARAAARITNRWDVLKGYHMKNAAELLIFRAVRGATAKVSMYESKRRINAWKIQNCWRRYIVQKEYIVFRNGWIAFQYECRQWRKRRRCHGATMIQKNARTWQSKSNYLSYKSAVTSLQTTFLYWRRCRRRHTAIYLQSWWHMVLPRRRYLNFRFYCIVSIQLKLKYWYHLKRNRQATKIQSIYRQFWNRQKYIRFKTALKGLQIYFRYKRNQKRKYCATKIQSKHRSIAVRQRIHPILFAFQTFSILIKWFLWKRKRIYRRHAAAIRLQALCRYAPSRLRYVRVKLKTIQMTM